MDKNILEWEAIEQMLVAKGWYNELPEAVTEPVSEYMPELVVVSDDFFAAGGRL